MLAFMDSLPLYIQQLDKLLLDLPTDEGMLMSELDGYLAGIIVSPELVLPGDWLKLVWGGGEAGAPPAYDDLKSVQTLVDLVMRHYNQMITTLDHQVGYHPLFDVDTRRDEILWETWIDGFSSAMELRPKGWHLLASCDDEAAVMAITGIAMLSEINLGESTLPQVEIDRLIGEAPDFIRQAVAILHRWTRDNDPLQAKETMRKKVGRNDPCSCGSGKKYKKCCGLN